MDFKTTKDIKVSPRIVEQIIGQDESVNIIKKAAKQRRHVLLIGDPGTGKSLLGQALAELLPKEKLVDILTFPNPSDENVPLIRTLPKGKGKELVVKSKLQTMSSFKNQNLFMLIIVIIISLIPYYFWKTGQISDVVYAASMISSMVFILGLILFINIGKRMKLSESPNVPKLLVDNSNKNEAPFIDACLLPGQKVFTNPYPMRIEETEGKMVYNSKGEPQRVIKVERIPWKGKIYQIKPRLLFPFKATQNHPFLVLERPKTKQFKFREFKRKKISENFEKHIKWKRAEELKKGDSLIYPKIEHPKIHQYLKILDLKNKIPHEIIFDEEIAEIFGWYLAEGYARIDQQRRKYYLGFVLGYNEGEYIKRLKYLIKKRFNLESFLDTHQKKSIELLVYSKPLTIFFKELFGLGARNKKIPKIIFESPETVKLSFLEAYIKGDGWEHKDIISVATTSKNVSEDLIFLLSSLGTFPTCSFRKMKDSKIKGREVKGPELYEFRITGKQLNKFGRDKGKFQHYFSKNNFNFIPIRDIWSEEYEGDIINMETEDGTYLMPCVTHNTGAHAGALLGDCLHDPLQSGGLGTPPHERLIAGMIHRANGGVLFIDELSTLGIRSQQEILTAIQEKKYPITGQSERSSGAMTRSEPVPTDFVLVAAGNLEILKHVHPALRSRITGYGYEVYMNTTMDDTQENKDKIAVFVAQEVAKDGKIPHFNKEAVEEIIHEARKRASMAGKLTLRLRELGGLIRAAGDLAKEQSKDIVTREHVLQAKKVSRNLEQQIADKYLENKKKYEVIITQGKKIGRVNGLAVIGSGATFSGIVLPIESEVVRGGGRKTEFVATGKLGEIAKEAVKNVSAIILKFFGEDIKEKYDIYIQFLQTYEGVEGDSASIAVATAIISALKEIPVRQDTAMTGSLSVRGDVLSVGGVTAKVEAAIDAGIKRIIVPKSNEKDIIIDKSKLDKIKIMPVEKIEEVWKEALDWSGKEHLLNSLLKHKKFKNK